MKAEHVIGKPRRMVAIDGARYRMIIGYDPNIEIVCRVCGYVWRLQ